jgi:hypothetical protein
MARPGFLNDNEARAYPFVPDPPLLFLGAEAVPLSYPAIVDFGCLVGLDADFDGRAHMVWLHSISRTGPSFIFEFRCSAPGLAGHALQFIRDLADAEFATDEAEAVELIGEGAFEPCLARRDDPLWDGWLTTGLLNDLAAALPDGQILLAGAEAPTIEPALIQDLSHGYVRTLNLANEDRTRATAPEGCSEASSESLGDPVGQDGQYRMIINRECLYGPQVLREGYNCVIRQNARENSITVSAALGGGAGEPCAEVPLAAAETPPPESRLLTGGPACDELITGINGLSAATISLVPLRGVRIAPDLGRPHTLVVDFGRQDMALCLPGEAAPGPG